MGEGEGESRSHSDSTTVFGEDGDGDDIIHQDDRDSFDSVAEDDDQPGQLVHLFLADDLEHNNNITDLIVHTRSRLELDEEVAEEEELNNNGGQRKMSRVPTELESEIPYTMLSKHEKVMIVVLVAFIGMFSAILQPIYFPILPLMKKKFHVSDEVMNLSVVLYLIFQGVAPTVMSNLADKFGRRPVILTCLLAYVGANIGLARANAYWLILVLRCCQSGGIAPVISINSGVVGDITQRFERGGYIGAVSGITLVGQGFGALIGLLLASSKFGWRSIFWFLSILPGVTLIFALFVLPETKRSIVGNISVKPKRLINKLPILMLPFFQRKLINQTESLAPALASFDIFALFRIMLLPEVACALFPSSVVFTTWTMSLTSYTTILTDKYHYSTMHIGLCYLPAGLGALCGSLVCGRVLDYVYKWEKSKYSLKYDSTPIDQRPAFNIFKARLQLFIVPSFLMTSFTIIFGWTLQNKCTISIVMVSAYFMAFSSTFPITMCTTILVDIFPGKSSTSTSLVNFSRCLAALVGTALLSKMVESMEIGGCYTFMACLCMLGNCFIYLSVFKGQKWADDRELKNSLKPDLLKQQQEDEEEEVEKSSS